MSLPFLASEEAPAYSGAGRWRGRGGRQWLGGIAIRGQLGRGYRGSQCLLGSEVGSRVTRLEFHADDRANVVRHQNVPLPARSRQIYPHRQWEKNLDHNHYRTPHPQSLTLLFREVLKIFLSDYLWEN